MSKKQDKNEFSESSFVIKGDLKETNIVQKSNPLFGLWKSKLTLSEFKILDIYLSRINSREPEHRTVIFEKGELEKLLGVIKINKPELEKRLEHLQGTIINIGDEKDIDKITLFERSQAVQDEYGLWQIKLTASNSAMKYIFNIEKIGYFRYQIRNIAKLTSIHTYILFTYFVHCLFSKNTIELSINLDELKIMLGCTTETYSEFKEFNKQVLKKCQKEMDEKTDLSFTYSTIRKNRKVAVIVFEVERVKRPKKILNEKKSECELIPVKQPECIPLIEKRKKPNPKQKMPVSENFHQTTMETDFTPEQIENLCYMLEGKLDNDDLVYIKKVLQGLYANMKLSAKGRINDPMSYIKKMIKNLKTEPDSQKNNINSASDIDKYKFVINNIPEPDQEEYDDEWYKEYETINK